MKKINTDMRVNYNNSSMKDSTTNADSKNYMHSKANSIQIWIIFIII